VGEVEFGSPCSITQTHYLEVSNTVGLKKNDAVGNFVTDACATVAVAYNRAAGVYVGDDELQDLGTAAVHLLTMATSYASAHEDGG
jgi:hypothetical protein